MEDWQNVPNTNTVGEPQRTSGGVGYQSTPALDAEEMYQVGTATYGSEGEIISTKSADTTNAGTDLNVPASEENLSAKYKYPNVSQDTSAMPSEEDGDEPTI